MKIFEVVHASNQYQRLVAENEATWKDPQWTFDGKPKTGSWNSEHRFRVYNPRKELGDFIYVTAGTIGLREPAVEVLRDFLEMAGELLPVATNIGPVWCLNVLEWADCLDHNETKWVLGQKTRLPIRIEKHVFVPSLLPESSLFKIPETGRGYVLTYEGLKDPEDEFVHAVQAAKLRGIKFELLWESPA